MPHEPDRRNRRTIDGVLVAGAAFVIGLGAVIAEPAPAEDEEVEQALVTLLGWAPAVWRAAVLGNRTCARGLGTAEACRPKCCRDAYQRSRREQLVRSEAEQRRVAGAYRF